MMKTGTLTLTDFLLARIAEDEAEAMKVTAPIKDGSAVGVLSNDLGALCLVVSPSRVLAECEAKRRIVDPAARWLAHNDHDLSAQFMTTALKALAKVYADHPDYREGWQA